MRAITLKVDVSNAQQIEAFRDQTLTRLGGVHVVCNNAGVSPLGAAVGEQRGRLAMDPRRQPLGRDPRRARLRAAAIAQGEGHIVNTASVAGLISPPGMGAYNVTKHAVVALSESLHHDLRERGSPVGVSVLCPAYVPTGIADSERNRPDEGFPTVGKSAGDACERSHAAERPSPPASSPPTTSRRRWWRR